MLEIFQLTYGCSWYSQISNKAHAWDPLPVGKSVNIRAILRYTGKFQRSIIFESTVMVIYLCLNIFFPIDHHCTTSSMKQNCMLFPHGVRGSYWPSPIIHWTSLYRDPPWGLNRDPSGCAHPGHVQTCSYWTSFWWHLVWNKDIFKLVHMRTPPHLVAIEACTRALNILLEYFVVVTAIILQVFETVWKIYGQEFTAFFVLAW